MKWTVATVRAALMLVASILLFLLIPDRLLAYISTRIVPRWRDLLMVVYMTVAFVFACWLFVRLQREPAP